MRNLAEMKRRLTPGTRIHIDNHRRPVATRDTVVLAQTNTVDLVTHGVDGNGKDVESHMEWPPADALRPNDDGSVTVMEYERARAGLRRTGAVTVGDEPFITITVLS